MSDEIQNKIKQELEGIPDEEIKKYGVDLSQGLKIYQGKGCEECGNLGFKGRIAIYEVIEVNDKIQELIAGKRGTENEIEAQARKEGMTMMRQDGILKVLKGITTLSEIDRVTKGNLNKKGDVEDV